VLDLGRRRVSRCGAVADMRHCARGRERKQPSPSLKYSQSWLPSEVEPGILRNHRCRKERSLRSFLYPGDHDVNIALS
jgi:hypothetical protein